uniref:uncharacterized protein n=1 Tax=Myxine glutinosa TaxID=7769 RepID=UPI00358F1181
MAPEITSHGYEGPPVDVWALGILFTTLFVGLHFHGRNIIQISHDNTGFNVGNRPPTFARKTLVSLLTAMLRMRPMERLTMTEIVNHILFKEKHPMKVLGNGSMKPTKLKEHLTSVHPENTSDSVDLFRAKKARFGKVGTLYIGMHWHQRLCQQS